MEINIYRYCKRIIIRLSNFRQLMFKYFVVAAWQTFELQTTDVQVFCRSSLVSTSIRSFSLISTSIHSFSIIFSASIKFSLIFSVFGHLFSRINLKHVAYLNWASIVLVSSSSPLCVI